jgi:hypothetical protein
VIRPAARVRHIGASADVSRPRPRALARALAAGLVAAALLRGAPAAANELKDKLEAQKLLDQGNRLAGDGDYVAALAKFRAAHARYPSPKILLNIGTTLRQLGRNVEAAEVYEAYLRDPKAESARAGDLKRILAEIDAVIGRVRLETSHEGARVRLDGKPLDGFKNGLVVRVEPGEHTVTAEHDAFPAAVLTVTIAPREERLVHLDFTPPVTKKVVVERPPNPLRIAGWVMGGIGAAGVIAGAAAGALAKVKNDAAEKHCLGPRACDQEGVDLGNAARTSGLASTIAFSIGGAALAAGVVLLVIAPSRDKAPKAGLAAPRLAAGAARGGPFVSVEAAW